MSFIAEIAELIEAVKEVNELKAALGFSDSTSISDIITQIKGVAAALAAANGTAPVVEVEAVAAPEVVEQAAVVE